MSQVCDNRTVPLSHPRHISGMKIDGPLKKLDLDGNLYTENQKPVTPAFEIAYKFT